MKRKASMYIHQQWVQKLKRTKSRTTLIINL